MKRDNAAIIITTVYNWVKTLALLGMCAAMLPVAAATLAPPALQVTTPEQISLSLDDCLRIARQNQINVLVGQQAVVSATARSTQANSSYYPQVAIQSNPLLLAGSSQRGANAQGGVNSQSSGSSFQTTRSSSSQGTTLSVTQNFWDGGLREENAASARYGITQNQTALLRALQTVDFTVTQNYFTALRNRDLAKVADEQVKYDQGQLNLIKGRVEAGAAAPSDELPIQAQLANAQVSQLTAQNAIRTALIILQNSMGLPQRMNFAIQDFGVPTPMPVQSLTTYLELAMRNRPDVRELHAVMQSAQTSVTTARINRYPRPVVSGAYNNLLGSGGGVEWAITGGIVFDIFDGGANKSAFTAARAGLVVAQDQEAQLAKDIEADVQQALFNLTDATARLSASAVSLQAAQKNFDAQTARYHEGLATPLDLLNAQVSLTTSQSTIVQAQYDTYIGQAQLSYAVGTPTPGDVQTK